MKAQGGDVHGLRSTAEFYRLFMVPGTAHCQGGPGATNFDMIEPLDQWADRGIAPAKVIAAHVTNGAVDRTWPLCPYRRKRSGGRAPAAPMTRFQSLRLAENLNRFWISRSLLRSPEQAPVDRFCAGCDPEWPSSRWHASRTHRRMV